MNDALAIAEDIHQEMGMEVKATRRVIYGLRCQKGVGGETVLEAKSGISPRLLLNALELNLPMLTAPRLLLGKGQ